MMRLVAMKRYAAVDDRLFRYDRRIAINATRATFRQWRDRLLALTMLIIVLATARSWFMDKPWSVASWQAFGASMVGAIAYGRLIQARLTFHAADGPFAADALRSRARLRYVVTWHAIGIAILVLVTAIVRAPLLIVSLPAYLMGAIAAHAASSISTPRLPIGNSSLSRSVRSWLRHPLAAGAGAMVLVASLAMLSGSLTQGMMVAMAGIETALLVLVLTTVDDGLVRFMALSGHGSWGTLVRHARETALFLGLAVPACLLAFGQMLGSVVAAVGAAGLLLMAMRILAYRLHRKRAADFLVTVLTALLALAAVYTPIIFPIIAIAIACQLHRRATGRTWMLP